MTKEQKREYNRAWAKAHPERRREINRQYRKRNAAKLQARRKQAWAALTDGERRAASKHYYALYKKRLAASPEYAERRRAQARAASLRYISTHKAEVAARHRAYIKKNMERANERAREYWAKPENAARKRQAMKKYRASAKGRAWRMAWNAKNADRVKATNRRSEAKRKVKKQTDAAYYAKRRADTRKRHAKAAVIAKGSYRPRYSTRIPDWCVMGGAVDVRSRFLFENATASDRAFARDLAIERRAQ